MPLQVRTRRCCALQEFPPRDAGCDLRAGLRFQHSVVTAVRHGKIQFVIEASCSQFCSVVRPTMPASQSPARIVLDPAAGSHQGPLPRYRGQVGQVDHPVHEAAVDSFPPGDFSQRLYLARLPRGEPSMTARERQLQRCRLAIPPSYRTPSGRGLAAIAVPSPQGLLGGLLQWQASFAGESDRADTNALTVLVRRRRGDTGLPVADTLTTHIIYSSIVTVVRGAKAW